MAVLMVMAIGGLTAPPSFATDYFVKYLREAGTTVGCHAPALEGARHGTAVFRRTGRSMFATVHLRNAEHNFTYGAGLSSRPCGVTLFKDLKTDGNGNGDVELGPVARQGKQAFWVSIAEDGTAFATGEVPAFGF